MVKRYELSEAQWRRIEDLLPGKPGDPGRTAGDNRLFVNGVLWVLRLARSGLPAAIWTLGMALPLPILNASSS